MLLQILGLDKACKKPLQAKAYISNVTVRI